jgi:hypothetical protein
MTGKRQYLFNNVALHGGKRNSGNNRGEKESVYASHVHGKEY